MSAVAKNKKVAELTAGELKSLIQDTLCELLDPDYGLELKPEIATSLKKSLKSKKRIPVEKVAKELGLKW